MREQRPPWAAIRDVPRPLDADPPWPRPIVKGTCRWCQAPAGTPRSTWCGQRVAGHLNSGCMRAVFAWWWSAIWVRRALFKRDGFTCQACGAVAPLLDVCGVQVHDMTFLHADHVVPLHRGGAHSWTNLQTLCGACNLSKGSGLVVKRLRQEVLALVTP